MKCVCPTCGSPMNTGRSPTEIPAMINLTKLRSRLIDALLKKHPGYVNSGNLFDHMYGDDPNGGPDGGTSTMNAFIWRLNRQLRPCGWEVTTNGARGSGSILAYRLEPYDET